MKFRKMSTVSIFLLATSLFAESVMDLNKEKKVFFGKVFTLYDNNHNEKISMEEYSIYLKERQKRVAEKQAVAMLKKCDKNANNKIDKSEISSEKSMFKMLEGKSSKRVEEICPLSFMLANTMDRNKDNFITKEEILDFFIKPKTLFPAFPKQVPLDNLKHFPMQTRVAMALEQCDSDHNKKLTPKEFTACKFEKAIFKEFDHDKNGVIERKDLIDIQEKKIFDTIDSNGDDSLDKNEFFENLNSSCNI